ncbi:MAG: hypothetical protein ACAI35_07075 [Candidatus Methylacidiphilales bacterium]|nr:hypothetical protein [Candidatus Methylacidiphilales bacterium]
MREVSPDVRYSVEQVLEHHASQNDKALVEDIRQQKLAGTRPLPSASLIDQSLQLDAATRAALIDKIAQLADESMYGRSEMGIEINTLLVHALDKLGVKSRLAVGNAMYFAEGIEIFRWPYIWVRAGKEILDVNIDVSREHPDFPKYLELKPYWGPAQFVPRDRKLHEDKMVHYMADDLEKHTVMWWKDLDAWMKENIVGKRLKMQPQDAPKEAQAEVAPASQSLPQS